MANQQKVLILGGGFGGIKAALELESHENFDVTLLSGSPDFRFYPALYRAATGAKSSAASIPLSEIFAGKNVEVIKDSAQKLDRQNRKIIGSSKKAYSYDVLVVAMGVVTNFFGIKGLDKYAYGIQSLAEAKRLRQHLHQLTLDERKPDLNYVVIGGGPTGVELAGALPTYLRQVMKSHNITNKSLHIDLVEAEDRLLPRMNRDYSYAVTKQLKRLGIKLILGQKVEAETADSLMVSDHDIKSHAVIWTAGVTNHPFLKNNDFFLNDNGQASVDKYLRSEDNIYVIGDNADTPYTGMAQTALYDAIYVANNLKRLSAGKRPKVYKPKRPVYVTPAGPKWAAVAWGHLQFYGRLGWWLRRAADLIAYHDLQPWWKASKHWLAEDDMEKICPTCSS